MEPLGATSSTDVVPARTLGRYELIGSLARGGMATVYLARHSGEAGFQRLYAIKVLHAHLSDDEAFVDMMLDEARLAARLHHPNVVPIVDLGTQDGAHYVVMEYIEGCSFSALLSKHRDERPARIIVPIVLDALAGLHAAHTLTDDDGNPMNLVHRDVSPQNVLVGVDGTARLIDFGVAKAESRIHSTRPGQMKGKLAFMAPEQVKNASKADRRSDIFSAGVMLWSALTGRKLFLADSDAETLHNILHLEIAPPSTMGHKPAAALDAVVLRALERDPEKRFQTALEMEEALREAAGGALGSKREITAWLTSVFEGQLADRRTAIRAAASGKRDAVQTHIVSQPSVSGLRMIPALGSAPETGHTPVSSRDLAAQDVRIESPSQTIAMEDYHGARRRRRAAATVAIGVAGLGLAVWLGLRTTERAAPAASPATTSSGVVPSPGESLAATASAGPTATASAPPSASAQVVVVSKPVIVAPAWRPAPPPPPKPKTAGPTTVAAASPPPPPPPPPDTKKKPHGWDNDSPLPPQ
jgi:serine/threonine-protein kinase